jgi:hypothetical protein
LARAELPHHLGQPLRPAVAAVLDVELEAPGVAQAEDRRRREGEHQPLLDVRRLHEELADQLRGVHPRPVVPVLVRSEDRGRAVAKAAAEEIQAGEGDGVLIGRVGQHRLGDLAHHGVGALQGGAVGQEHRADIVAGVLVGHQAGGRAAPQPGGDGHHAEKQRHADRASPQQPAHAVGIARGHAAESVVEPAEEQAGRAVAALQDQHAQRGREGKRDEAGDDHRDGDGHCELPVQLAGEPPQECDRHEHRA